MHQRLDLTICPSSLPLHHWSKLTPPCDQKRRTERGRAMNVGYCYIPYVVGKVKPPSAFFASKGVFSLPPPPDCLPCQTRPLSAPSGGGCAVPQKPPRSTPDNTPKCGTTPPVLRLRWGSGRTIPGGRGGARGGAEGGSMVIAARVELRIVCRQPCRPDAFRSPRLFCSRP